MVLLPTLVTPPPKAVPLLMVTYSLIVTLSPIITSVFSPLYFKSCGAAEITDPGKILQFLPIFFCALLSLVELVKINVLPCFEDLYPNQIQ